MCALQGVYLFTGLDHWTGVLDWTTGLTFDPQIVLHLGLRLVHYGGDGLVLLANPSY